VDPSSSSSAGHPEEEYILPRDWSHLLRQFKTKIPEDLYDLLRFTIPHEAGDRISVCAATKHRLFTNNPDKISKKVTVNCAFPPGDYTSKVGSVIGHEDRRMAVEWLIDVQLQFLEKSACVVQSVHLLDDFFASVDLYSMACIWVINKFHGVYTPPTKLTDMLDFSPDDLLKAEVNLLQKLHFLINRRPTPEALRTVSDASTLKRCLAHPRYMRGELVLRQSQRASRRAE
jgi:hypothetical protein